jgi:methionyl-tRNA formyltransferase
MNVIAISNNLYDETSLFSKENVVFIKEKADLSFDNLKKINPEYVFFPHWSYIITSQIYENFQCVIFHMTDLPFGRGGSPLQNLISRGIYDTKISAIKCVKELDAGDVYLKKDFSIKEGSAKELYAKAGEIISTMIDEIIETRIVPSLQKGNVVEFKRRKYDESNMRHLKTMSNIYDHIRMLDAPGYPRAFLEHGGNIKLSFYGARLANGKINACVEIEEI